MKDNIIIRENSDLNLSDEMSNFSFRLGGIICSMIGIWGLTCLAVALYKFGAGSLIRGYISAITGV